MFCGGGSMIPGTATPSLNHDNENTELTSYASFRHFICVIPSLHMRHSVTSYASFRHFICVIPSLHMRHSVTSYRISLSRCKTVGLSSAVSREASMRAESDPRYQALSGLWGPDGSDPPGSFKSPFIASSLSWTGGSLFASMKVLLALDCKHSILFFLIQP